MKRQKSASQDKTGFPSLPTFLTRHGLYIHLAVIAGLFLILFFRVIAGLIADLGRTDEPWQIVFVPFLSGMIISRIRSETPARPMEWASGWAFPLIAVAFILHGFGVVTQVNIPSRVAMVIFIQGAVLLTCGKATFKRFLFPLAYLFLAIPLPWQVSVLLSTPLKVLSARISAVVLDAFGFTVLRQGTILQFPEFTIGVAEVCSGLQSIFTLVIASIPIAYLTGASHGRILAIFLASVFLGSAANVTRIVVTAVLVSKAGPKVAEGLPHTALGMVIVFLAFLLLYGFASVISRRRGQQAGD